MVDPFKSLPLNTAKVYTMATTSNGCEIYIPVLVNDDFLINQRQNELKTWLKRQGAKVIIPFPDDTLA